jgi:hypothetical protein
MKNENIQNDQNDQNERSCKVKKPKKCRPTTKLDKIIEKAANDGLELIPLDYSLIACTPDQRDKYVEENKKSKVFKRNYDRLREALLEKKSVTYSGRNLYVVPSKEHDIIQAKDRQSVVKFREGAKLLKQLQAENEKFMKEKEEKEKNVEEYKDILKIFGYLV